MILPALVPSPQNSWSDRLAFDMALSLEGSGDDIKEIMVSHKLTITRMREISKDPLFQTQVGNWREEIKSKGLTFKLKARAQAEELLTTSWNLIHSADIAGSVKADLIKWTAKMANLEPAPGAEGQTTNGVKITINLGPQEIKTPMRVIEHE